MRSTAHFGDEFACHDIDPFILFVMHVKRGTLGLMLEVIFHDRSALHHKRYMLQN